MRGADEISPQSGSLSQALTHSHRRPLWIVALIRAVVYAEKKKKTLLRSAGRGGSETDGGRQARIPKAPRILKIDKQRLGLPDRMLGVAFLAAVTVLRSPPAVRRRGSQHRTVISDPENPAGQPQQINNGLMDLVLLVNLGGIGKAFEDSQPRSGVPNVTGSLGFPSLTPVTGPVKMWRRRLTPALNQPASGNAGVVRPPLIHGHAFVYGTTRMRPRDRRNAFS